MLAWVMNLGFGGGTAGAVVVTATPSGRSRRKRRYSVEVEGEFWVFDTISEVEAFLAQTRETVEQEADRIVTTEVVPKPPKIRVKTRTGPTTSKVLKQAVSRTQKAITKAYARAAERRRKERELDMQIAEALHTKLREEDDTIIALIL